MNKQRTKRRIRFTARDIRTVWYDPNQYVYFVNRVGQTHRFASMTQVEQFVKSNGYRFVE